MRTANMFPILTIVAVLVGGCGKGWQMDYGTPVAQFLEEDVAAGGKDFIGKKITVKGTVTGMDGEDPQAPWVHLGHGIRCNFGAMRAMAESCRVGDTITVDGFLKQCEAGNVVLEPAVLRDPQAPFSPQ